MDFGAVTAKKLSNGYGVPGKSAYDGVFASPVKFRAPSLSSSFEDYCEIFGGSKASIGSSIPVLEVPELNETKILRDVQRSKLDYSKVFGGFGNLDTAVPYEELLAESKKKDSFPKGASSQDKGGKPSSKDSSNCSKQVPLVSQETSYGAKKINMSYHKINQGSENRKNGTTHIAQVHAVPAYTCLIEEVNPLKINRDDQSIPELRHAYPGSDCAEGIKRREHYTKSVNDPSPDGSMKESSKGGISFQDRSDLINMFFDASEVSHGSDVAKKQSSNGGVKVEERSDSISMFSNECEVNHGSDGTDYIKVPQFQTVVGNLDDHGHAVRSVAAQCQASASEAAAGAYSPEHLDDMIDSSSEAAASVAALRKAIEEAQERLKVAKDLMKRKKEGFPNRIKRRLNNDLKAEGKEEDKFAHKTMRHDGTSLGQTSVEMDVLPKSSVPGKPRKEQVTLDLRAEEMFVAKEAVRRPEKLESTLAEHSKEEEVGHKEAAPEETLFEPKDVENKEVLCTVDDYHWYEKNAGKNAFEKLEESHQTIEMVEGPCEPEANEEQVNVDDEAGQYEEFMDTKMFMCEELVDDTKLAQETLDSGAEDKNLKVEDEPVTDYKVASLLEQEDSERKIGEEGLSMGDEKKINCKSEDEKKVDGTCGQEECSRNLRDHQEFIELKKNVTLEEIESEEKVESFSHVKEFELREDMKSIKNGKPFNIHDSDLISLERQMENWSFVEEGKKMNTAVLSALNQETEHHYQREGNENRVGNIHVQEILEGILGHADDEEVFHEAMTKDRDSDRNERVEDAKEDEMEIKGAIYLTEETEKHSRETVKIMKVIENGSPPNYEERKTEEADRTTEISPITELDGDNLSKIEVAADTTVECDKIPEVTPEEYSLSEQDEILVASSNSHQHEEKRNEPESPRVINNLEEKLELTSTVAQGALQLNQAMNQMQYANETVSFDSAATNIGYPHAKVEQNPSDCWKEAEDNCNLAMPVEEPSLELGDVSKYMKEDEDGLKAKIDENQCNSSYEEISVDNESNMEASQPPLMLERKSSSVDRQEIEQAHSNLKKNDEASLTMEEKKADETSQKVEPDTDHLKRNEGAKEKQRERARDREKIAVERAIREARERAFAEARERAALERAAAEARRKNVSDGRERLVRTTGQANEKTSTERAAMEAKLKAERAAVERATAEARARALERALSEKAASESRKKSDKFFGASRDNGMNTNFHSKSFSYGDTFDGADGDSAQRCKARSERHQRIGERVAKALAEKNARDRLVQKEQEERNRVAEALDGDVKRWSSGKEGNLRALLSTLQYILGPDSGWQPIHLTDIVNTTAVKKAYRKATLFVHPDKLQQRGATIQQKYICEKVFDLLKEAWNKFNMEER